jgi:hypothetical protein
MLLKTAELTVLVVCCLLLVVCAVTASSRKINDKQKMKHSNSISHLLLTRKSRATVDESARQSDELTTDNNLVFVFDLPDIVAQEDTLHGQVQLEGYMARDNTPILNANDAQAQQSKLYWVSIGDPTFLNTKNLDANETDDELQLFHFEPEGVYTFIQLLTRAQSVLLADTANYKYNLTVRPSQIVALTLSRFVCTLPLIENGVKYLLKGEVTNFRKHPLRMDFYAPQDSTERRLFEKRIQESTAKKFNARFVCEMASRGKVTKTNYLTVSSKQIQSLRIAEDLFGPATSTLVSREQLAELAHKIYSSLDIVEDYEMTEIAFSESFMSELLSQSIVESFNHVPIEKAAQELSRFATNFDQDLQADIIKRNLSSILEVKEKGGKSHIVLSGDTVDHLKTKDSVSGGNKVSAGIPGLIDASTAVNFAVDLERDELRSNKSLDDQLKELNEYSKNDIKWEIEGNKVIPKSLNVARLSKSSFEKSISFRRIMRELVEAPFTRKTSIYTAHSLNKDAHASLLELSQKFDNEIRDIKNENKLEMKKLKNEIENVQMKQQTGDEKIAHDMQNTQTSFESKLEAEKNKTDKMKSQLQDLEKRQNTMVAFDVYRSTSYTQTETRIPYDGFLMQIGGGMDLSSGVFTAPVAGIYAFTGTWADYSNSDKDRIQIRKNGLVLGATFSDTTDYNSMGTTVLVSVDKGDEVYTYLSTGSVYLVDDNRYTHFTGYLIYPM